ncbi:hypothetical protein Aazo_0361 ['Nostoc azollae' 0708]|jgi:hypothetical protein|uniref:Uncharacterized protein n=1 Tax=Nostoc azollae (strain 0708) TaxID=551115 RepID=D7DZI0_NOSA0|nr:hypothetical protein Aazo_0361 ['Nostoc azollae' 0708]
MNIDLSQILDKVINAYKLNANSIIMNEIISKLSSAVYIAVPNQKDNRE